MIPFKFVQPSRKTDFNVTERKQDSTKNNPDQLSIYQYLKKQQALEIDKKKKNIDSIYEAELKAIKPASNIDEVDKNKMTRSLAREKRDRAYKDIALLEIEVEELDYLDRTNKSFNFFEVKNSTDAQIYYEGDRSNNNRKFLNNTLISFSTDGGKASIYNELFADYAGPIRIGFGALISNKQSTPTSANADEKKEDAVQRLLGGGGNGVFNLSYPIMDLNSNSFNIKLIAAPKMAIDIPKIGTNNNQYAFNWNPGLEGSIFYTGVLKVITFYTNFRFGYIDGNNLFYDNLANPDRKAFAFNQLAFGIGFTSTFRLSYNTYFGSNFVKNNFPGALSFVFVPN